MFKKGKLHALICWFYNKLRMIKPIASRKACANINIFYYNSPHIFQHLLQDHNFIFFQEKFPENLHFLAPRAMVSPGPAAKLRRERNHCEQPFAFPSSMRIQVTYTSKRQMTSLALFSQET